MAKAILKVEIDVDTLVEKINEVIEQEINMVDIEGMIHAKAAKRLQEQIEKELEEKDPENAEQVIAAAKENKDDEDTK